MKLFEDITYTDEELQPIVNFCEVNQEFSPVVTKFNKDNQWTAISLRGYGSETTQIGKGGVLGTNTEDGLQNTILYDALGMDKILDKIPAEKERVRLMKLEVLVQLSQNIQTKLTRILKLVRLLGLHVPVITHEEVLMTSWLSGGIAEFHMKKGSCWWLDVSQPHKVVNKSDIDRVHLVIDIYNNDVIKEQYFS